MKETVKKLMGDDDDYDWNTHSGKKIKTLIKREKDTALARRRGRRKMKTHNHIRHTAQGTRHNPKPKPRSHGLQGGADYAHFFYGVNSLSFNIVIVRGSAKTKGEASKEEERE